MRTNSTFLLNEKNCHHTSLKKNLLWFYSLGLFLFLGFFFSPAFAEVASIGIDGNLFYKEDQIVISGTVEEGSIGLVTIVIRDQSDEFVLLTHSKIHYDDTFEAKINVEDQFDKSGSYFAKGFILDMSDAEIINFDVSLDEIPIRDAIKYDAAAFVKPESVNTIRFDALTSASSGLASEPLDVIAEVSRPSFMDPDKDPHHYVERYYSEPHYKSWFDRNYPGQSIEDAVGYAHGIDDDDDDGNDAKLTVKEIIDVEIIPEAQASSPVAVISSDTASKDFDIAQITLAVAGLGILFGAVYGVKRQADSNTKQIMINKNVIRKKILNPIMGSSPKEILQMRMAKGEITVEEYDLLRSKLN
mgnify:CR=1 FL=1